MDSQLKSSGSSRWGWRRAPGGGEGAQKNSDGGWGGRRKPVETVVDDGWKESQVRKERKGKDGMGWKAFFLFGPRRRRIAITSGLHPDLIHSSVDGILRYYYYTAQYDAPE